MEKNVSKEVIAEEVSATEVIEEVTEEKEVETTEENIEEMTRRGKLISLMSKTIREKELEIESYERLPKALKTIKAIHNRDKAKDGAAGVLEIQTGVTIEQQIDSLKKKVTESKPLIKKATNKKEMYSDAFELAQQVILDVENANEKTMEVTEVLELLLTVTEMVAR